MEGTVDTWETRGVIRKVDKLGRIVIPVEIRKVYDLKEGDGLEIIEKDNEIVIKKCLDTYCPKCLKSVHIRINFVVNVGFILKQLIYGKANKVNMLEL